MSTSECEDLIQTFENFESARWVKRTQMNAYRGIKDLTCSYSVCANKCMPKESYAKLLEMAPEIEGCRVEEIVVNRYFPGDYIPDHRDRAPYAYNMLINLQDSTEDGISIEGIKYPDELGRAVIFKGNGLTHSVKPVINKRYVLIYLYERNYV